MDIERIKTTFLRAGWHIIPTPSAVVPVGSLIGEGPSGYGVLMIRGDGSGASIQLPMHRKLTELQAEQSILFGRLLVASLPQPINAPMADWYDRSIIDFSRTLQRNNHNGRATKTSNNIVTVIEWIPQAGKLIVEIQETP